MPDNVPGVVYITGPKVWKGKRVFVRWPHEQRILSSLPAEKKIVIFLDNASGYVSSEKINFALEKLSIELRYLAKDATDLCQPAAYFFIQKIRPHGVNSGT